jgi:hypothetical protein
MAVMHGLDSMTLERIDQIMKSLVVGIIQAHEDFMGFQHLDPYDLLRLIL